MDSYYSKNKNVLFLVRLLKEHGIKKVIASPGTTNMELMASLQCDDYFEMYSCVDERSAAYMACGLASESLEPVVITCTEATASRDYYPGLTEAYHRKLPVLAVTGLHDYNCVGHLEPQVIDRSVSPNDTMRLKVNLPVIKDSVDEWESQVKINMAILELSRNGGGPVHINIPWGGGDMDFSVKDLPEVKVIRRYNDMSELPIIEKNKKIVVFIGGHHDWDKFQEAALDHFCAVYNAVAICDHTSRYYGKYRVQPSLLVNQKQKFEELENIDLLIHIGEEFGDDTTKKELMTVKEVWRVSPDGEVRDTFKKLTNVFEMKEETFFKYYSKDMNKMDDSLLIRFRKDYQKVLNDIPVLPFSSIYVASIMSKKLPSGSVLHLGLSDSIRAWNYFELPQGVKSRCNSGCRGIDGCVSTLIGSSLVDLNKLCFGVFGDLTFFYDMNVLGNRHVPSNVRIVLVNNNGGNIFRHNGHASLRWLGFENANEYIAAGGHFSAKAFDLVKNYVSSLGFDYLSAKNKTEFLEKIDKFTDYKIGSKPIVFEIFTESKNDSDAFDLMNNIALDEVGQVKAAIKSVLGTQGTSFVKKIIKKN